MTLDDSILTMRLRVMRRAQELNSVTLACRADGLAWDCSSTTAPGPVGCSPSGLDGSSAVPVALGEGTCTSRGPAS